MRQNCEKNQKYNIFFSIGKVRLSRGQEKRSFYRRAFYDKNGELINFGISSKYVLFVFCSIIVWGVLGLTLTLGGLVKIMSDKTGQRLLYVIFVLMGLCFIKLTVGCARRFRVLWKLRENTPYPKLISVPLKTFVNYVATDVAWLAALVPLVFLTYILDKLH